MTEVKYDIGNGHEISVEYDEHNITKITRECFEALIEKQIPKKPIPQDEDCLECPNCDSFIGYASECKDEHYRVEYCPNCGQKLDWGDE